MSRRQEATTIVVGNGTVLRLVSTVFAAVVATVASMATIHRYFFMPAIMQEAQKYTVETVDKAIAQHHANTMHPHAVSREEFKATNNAVLREIDEVQAGVKEIRSILIEKR